MLIIARSLSFLRIELFGFNHFNKKPINGNVTRSVGRKGQIVNPRASNAIKRLTNRSPTVSKCH